MLFKVLDKIMLQIIYLNMPNASTNQFLYVISTDFSRKNPWQILDFLVHKPKRKYFLLFEIYHTLFIL
jgi:hypothetical protein